jgi:histone-lysine N-methyltransferase SETD1
LKVPIEELVIVRRKIIRNFESDESEDIAHSEMTIRKSYSYHTDTYTSLVPAKELPNENNKTSQMMQVTPEAVKKRCLRCRHMSSVTKRLAGVPHLLCELCIKLLKDINSVTRIPEDRSKKFQCDCDNCVKRLDTTLLSRLSKEVLESVSRLGSTLEEIGDYSRQEDSGFISSRFVVKGIHPVDFAVSPDYLESLLSSSTSKPVTKVKPRVSKKTKKSSSLSIQMTGANDTSALNNKKSHARNLGQGKNGDAFTSSPRKEVFRATSARLLPYNAVDRKFDVSATELYQWKMFNSSAASVAYPEKTRTLRRLADNVADADQDGTAGKKKLLGRAARAQQRRLAKSVAAMGVNMDILAGREQQLRFDRSGIHDWGVFVDIDIQDGEMIVEYRGEIIGNAVAEKREKEYEAAKIGSDYMFRMDDLTVCDATKQGNVARFINASCDPNCYTKIISSDGTKRIVVYAKRDIKSGEELCYDYKFPLEYDPAQRIPCRCGARECRG